MQQRTAAEFERLDGLADWRCLGTGATAWFDAASLTEGAQLADRIAALVGAADPPDVDLRPTGVRVRVGAATVLTSTDVELARDISAAAHHLGLAGDPAVLQVVGLAVDTTDPPVLTTFWRTVLAYDPAGDDGLQDRSRRDPLVTFHDLEEPRPLRSRIHVDVVRSPAAVDAIKAEVGREAFGPYGVALADDDGNEIDLVPGDELAGGPETSDWRVVFAAMAFYRISSATQASAFATVVARLADEAGLPLLIDLRPDGVTLDSGKDLWDDNSRATGTTFADLAAQIQAAARDLALVADVSPLRFVQLGVDAADVAVTRAFWATLLGYQLDTRDGVTDIYDPRRLAPEIIFQEIDVTEVDRRRQRNRLRFELSLPHDQLAARIDVAVAAGGQVTSHESPERCTITDPEGNEVDLITRR